MLLFFFAVLGALSGSFAGVLSERLNTGGSWRTGRSRCNTCSRELGPFDLIPVLSWLIAGGACRACAARIPARYVVVEMLFGFLFALSYLRLGISLALLVLLLLLIVLGALVLYDIRHTIVPESLSRILLALAFVFSVLTAPSVHMIAETFLTAGIIALSLFVLYAASHGRAMGLGDAPVALSLSLMAGAAAIPGILFSFWIGALYGIFVLVLRRKGPKMGIEVPFVPFLATGFLLAYFTGWNPLAIVLL